MADAISRFLFERLDIRGVVVQLGSSWRDMLAGRGYPDAVRDLLGQLAAVTAVIGGNLKSENRMSFQLQGGGPVSILVMDCQPITNGPLRLRGMARMRGEESIAVLPEPTCGVTDLLGDGKLVLTLHQGDAQAYQSVVPLDGNTVAQVFEHYLAQSEQQPARLWLAATADTACGLFLQKLPGADGLDPDGWNRIEQLAATVRHEELALSPATLLTRLFNAENVRLYAPRQAAWHCPRDEEKVRNMLLSLGREELEAMLADAEMIAIEDEICGHEYRFGPEIVDELFPPEGRILH